MRTLNKVQFRFQDTAPVLHPLMMGIGRCLIELDDHVHGGAVVAPFEDVKVVRQLMLVAVGKAQSGNQQREQGQKREPCAPGGCVKDAVLKGSPGFTYGGHYLFLLALLKGPSG